MEDDNDTDDFLDPELQRIKESARQQSVRAESVDRFGHPAESERDDEDQANQVKLTVTWIQDDDNSPSLKPMEFPYPRVGVPVILLKSFSSLGVAAQKLSKIIRHSF